MKWVAALAAVLLLLTVLCTAVAAEDIDLTLEGYDEFLNSLPEELPTDELGEVTADAKRLTSWSFATETLGVFLGDGLKNALPMLCKILGLLLISAVMSALSSNFGGKTAELLGLMSGCAVTAAVVFLQLDSLLVVSSYLTDLTTLVNGMTPIILTLYASGGNVASASVSGGAMTVFLALCENLLKSSLLPFVGCCLCLSAAQASGMGFSGLLSLIKKTYTTALCFLMSIFCAVLGAQNALAAGSDTVSLRAVKFVAGSSIPMVGGSVSESMKTLAASVSMLRKCFGVTGIVLIALLTLPILISLLLTRTVLNICTAAADLLGVEREKRLLTELSGIYGALAAVVSCCSLMFIFLLTLLLSSITALV